MQRTGERNPRVLAQLAHSLLRAKISEREEAFTGYFDDHHRFLLEWMLSHPALSPPPDGTRVTAQPGTATATLPAPLERQASEHAERTHTHIHQLEALGYTVTLTPAA